MVKWAFVTKVFASSKFCCCGTGEIVVGGKLAVIQTASEIASIEF